ncbi:cupin domain-containing protein [Streptomyces sp. NPDC101132]|uniref:cupin domain-containing protein n=1 Tax=Streptomyces sp. NPDC101132 TaxID=3366110 RepID=UPI0037FEAE3A
MTLRSQGALYGPGEGFVLPRPKVTERLALPASATGGGLTLMEITVEPGGLVAPEHTHTREDESAYVIEGELTLKLGGELLTAGADSALFAPRGTPHTFFNAGTTTARMVLVVTPGNLDDYFKGIPALGAGGPPPPHRVAEHAAEYGMALRPESLAELAERHGVTLV